MWLTTTTTLHLFDLMICILILILFWFPNDVIMTKTTATTLLTSKFTEDNLRMRTQGRFKRTPSGSGRKRKADQQAVPSPHHQQQRSINEKDYLKQQIGKTKRSRHLTSNKDLYIQLGNAIPVELTRNLEQYEVILSSAIKYINEIREVIFYWKSKRVEANQLLDEYAVYLDVANNEFSNFISTHSKPRKFDQLKEYKEKNIVEGIDTFIQNKPSTKNKSGKKIKEDRSKHAVQEHDRRVRLRNYSLLLQSMMDLTEAKGNLFEQEKVTLEETISEIEHLKLLWTFMESERLDYVAAIQNYGKCFEFLLAEFCGGSELLLNSAALNPMNRKALNMLVELMDQHYQHAIGKKTEAAIHGLMKPCAVPNFSELLEIWEHQQTQEKQHKMNEEQYKTFCHNLIHFGGNVAGITPSISHAGSASHGTISHQAIIHEPTSHGHTSIGSSAHGSTGPTTTSHGQTTWFTDFNHQPTRFASAGLHHQFGAENGSSDGVFSAAFDHHDWTESFTPDMDRALFRAVAGGSAEAFQQPATIPLHQSDLVLSDENIQQKERKQYKMHEDKFNEQICYYKQLLEHENLMTVHNQIKLNDMIANLEKEIVGHGLTIPTCRQPMLIDDADRVNSSSASDRNDPSIGS